ncbi:hypothetical protein B0H15DRAFT_955164 [Mycena belliarum]|uniref:Uncharacterized protein n=1 Tax=Mycena belliarum TaxID=1033014 RepID=A0AAD6XNQ7_9AGAR|nr:hypothetical protein B0H15DRAFT_955164 [Mycena belliae]
MPPRPHARYVRPQAQVRAGSAPRYVRDPRLHLLLAHPAPSVARTHLAPARIFYARLTPPLPRANARSCTPSNGRPRPRIRTPPRAELPYVAALRRKLRCPSRSCASDPARRTPRARLLRARPLLPSTPLRPPRNPPVPGRLPSPPRCAAPSKRARRPLAFACPLRGRTAPVAATCGTYRGARDCAAVVYVPHAAPHVCPPYSNTPSATLAIALLDPTPRRRRFHPPAETSQTRAPAPTPPPPRARAQAATERVTRSLHRRRAPTASGAAGVGRGSPLRATAASTPPPQESRGLGGGVGSRERDARRRPCAPRNAPPTSGVGAPAAASSRVRAPQTRAERRTAPRAANSELAPRRAKTVQLAVSRGSSGTESRTGTSSSALQNCD